jgi:hypothetical protein
MMAAGTEPTVDLKVYQVPKRVRGHGKEPIGWLTDYHNQTAILA